jgi:hypothetical protein
MPPVVTKAGNVVPEMPMRPVSSRTDVLEKLRARCSKGSCLSYCAATKTLYFSLVRSPKPNEPLSVVCSPPLPLRVGAP